MKSFKNISLVVLVIIGTVLSVYRISNVKEKEISWDVLGYYLPLPATFIYGEPMLDNVDWLKKINDEQGLTGTLYMVSSNDEGEPMYFFLLGMSFLYLPFFLAGHFLTSFTGFPADGFSLIYQYALVVGGIFYTLIGLVFLRKNLKNYFSEGITALVLLIIVFSTNYIHHLTLKNLETVNVLFMLVNIVLWYTIQWHKIQKLKYLVAIGVSVTLMGLVKPSEVIIVLLPLLWNVYSNASLKEKVALIVANKYQFLLTIGIAFLVASPQIAYWLIKTGQPVYDSYKNPGIGLDIFSPHIIDSLFSYRKGWLLYTPVMIFSLLGFPVIYKQNKKIFYALITYFLISFYIISSWSEWWYGAGFSNRPLITIYPILAISLGYFMVYLSKKTWVLKALFAILVICFTCLNQFQWWQFKNYILSHTQTTKAYYWATFLKTSVTPKDKELLLIQRTYSGRMPFENRDGYQSSLVQELTFEDNEQDGVLVGETGNKFYRLAENQDYALTRQIDYSELTDKDHLWVVLSFDLRFADDFEGQWPCMVITMDRKGGNYGYYAPQIKPKSLNNKWEKYTFEYLTPELRNRDDDVKFFFWKRGKSSFDVDNFKVEVFEKVSN
ncbi:MAG: hypothetical protein DRI89_02545 [Bacteroidetes bacterium]|nr:MAG: hypothetical protein DRI89_02545 [Bacteroidota bacterium]